MFKFFNIVAGAYPVIIMFIIIGHFIGTKNPESLYLFIWLLLMGIINTILKKGYVGIFGKKVLPFFGKSERPSDAKNCGIIPGMKYPSSGMPSGHSQFAAFFSIYSILVINDLPIIDTIKNTFAVILIVIAFWIMYSRLLHKCHTLQQVIFGGLLGCIFGVIAYKLKNDIVRKMM